MAKLKDVKIDQLWTLSKSGQKLVKEVNELDFEIGETVHVNNPFGGEGLINVTAVQTGIQFDITAGYLKELLN